MLKTTTFLGKTASGIHCVPLFGSSGTFEKTAGAPAFADWESGDELRKYISKITKSDRERNAYVLVNALGAGEYFGSNINADYFEWNVLAHEGDDYGYKTFLNAHAFQHHVNKDPTRAFGVPVLSILNTKMKRVELLIKLDREKAKLEGADGVITRIDKGEFPDVSMGAKVPYDICYVCGHRSKTRNDYCVHMKPPEELRHLYGPNKILPDGKRCCVKNPFARFFDISFVFIGADKTAKVMAKLASSGNRVCLGDICSVSNPLSSAEIAEHTKTAFRDDDIISGGKADKKPLSSFNSKALKQGVKVESEHTSSKALAKEIASDHLEEDSKYYDKLKTIHKEASASCGCGCPGDCSDIDKLEFAFTGKKPKTASQLKIGEITKTVPAGAFSMKLPNLEKDEITISRSALDEMAEHDLGSICSTASMMGIVFKPHEFQYLVLKKMGDDDLATEFFDANQVFKQSEDFDDSLEMDKLKFNEKVRHILYSLIGQRSGFGAPFQMRVIKISSNPKKTLPTESSINHPLLDKVAAAYNGYRRELIEKLSQVEEVVLNDPKLREEVLGDSLVNMFTKTSSISILSPDSLSYFAGVHLQNRDLLSNTPVDSGVVHKS